MNSEIKKNPLKQPSAVIFKDNLCNYTYRFINGGKFAKNKNITCIYTKLNDKTHLYT